MFRFIVLTAMVMVVVIVMMGWVGVSSMVTDEPVEPGRNESGRAMTFYDYDMVLTPKGEERHILRVDGQRLPAGRFCRITRAKNGHGWERLTQWDSKHGRRSYWFATLDEAMTTGIKWAKKRFSDG